MAIFGRMRRMGQVETRVEVRIRALEDSSKGITSLVGFALTQECYFFRGGRGVSLPYSLQQFCTVSYLFQPEQFSPDSDFS